MKRKIIICVFSLWTFSYLIAQNVEILTFVDDFTTDSVISYTPLRAKSLRKMQSYGGIIEMTYPSAIADTLKQAIEIAAQLWADCLPIDTYIKVDAIFDNIVNDVEVQVPYIPDNGFLYPMSYYRNKINDYPLINDGTIIFSNAENWSCRFSNNSAESQKLLSVAALRAIARILGFGTTVTQNSSGAVFFNNASNTEYTPFEHLVFNDTNLALTSISKGRKNRDNVDLHSYSQPTGNLWVKKDNHQYKLYAPTPFERNKSLVYLDQANCLMHYKMPTGSFYLDVDTITQTIIKAIGWDIIDSHTISLYCDDIPATGIASAYNTYLFKINNYSSAITSLYWEYAVKSSDGDYSVIQSQDGGLTFSVSPSNYFSSSSINSEGDIEGVVRLTYVQNGVEKKISNKYTFECAPSILGFYNQEIHDNGYTTYYDYSFSVAYRGAQSVTLGIEQEYSSFYDIIHINEPFLAHAYVSLLSRGNTVWIDVSVENDYGSDFQTIEIPVQTLVKATNVMDLLNTSEVVDHINVYRPNGIMIKTIKSLSELSEFSSCDLILQYMGIDNKQLHSRKIRLK